MQSVRPQERRSTICWFTCAMLLAPARAHVGDLIGGIDLLEPSDPSLPTAIEASYGLILQQGDTYAWVCHEAVTAPGAIRAPRYQRASDGAWLVTVSDPKEGRGGRTLFRSPDGCSWQDVSGVDPGVVVAQAIFDPADPALAWAVTATPGGANGVLASIDGGQSWAPALPAQPDQLFHSVALHAGVRWATSTDPEGTSGTLWRQPPGGSWAAQPVELPQGTETAQLKIAAIEGDTIWLEVDPIGADTLLRSLDGGASFHIVVSSEGNISDTALHGDTLWFIVDGRQLLPIVDGVVGEPVPGFAPSAGLRAGEDGLWLPEQSYLSGPMLSHSSDGGQTFVPLAYPDDISAPLDCPAGTHGADICTPLWDDLLPRIRGFDSPPIDTLLDTGQPQTTPPTSDAPPTPQRCGCHGSSGGWLWLGLVGLGLRRGGRRSRGAGSAREQHGPNPDNF